MNEQAQTTMIVFAFAIFAVGALMIIGGLLAQ
jgi:hypothetical protein